MSRYDAILIPGGGVRARGELPPWTTNRLDLALRIYNNEYIITLSAGTTYKPPPLDPAGFPFFESKAAAHYLIQHGIHPKKILTETCSYDTIGNAYFARILHVDLRGFNNLLIITSEFHLPRTEHIFRWIFSLEPPFGGYFLHFLSAPDEGLDELTLAARKEKEEKSIQNIFDLKARIHSLSQLHEWLYTEHTAYQVSNSPQKIINDNALDSY